MTAKRETKTWSEPYNKLPERLQGKVSEWLLYTISDIAEYGGDEGSSVVKDGNYRRALPDEETTRKLLEFILINKEKLGKRGRLFNLKRRKITSIDHFWVKWGTSAAIFHWLLGEDEKAYYTIVNAFDAAKKMIPPNERRSKGKKIERQKANVVAIQLPLAMSIIGRNKEALQLAFDLHKPIYDYEDTNDLLWKFGDEDIPSINRVFHAGDIINLTDDGLANIVFGDKGVIETFRDAYKYASFVRQKLSEGRNRPGILITGETGTGKESLAKFVANTLSPDKGFYPLNCKGYRPEVLQAELFGVEKGFFTGVDPREGLLKQANGGTIFLDEIDGLSAETQGLLLRVLQERRVRKVGAIDENDADFHLICASNKLDLLGNEEGLSPDFYSRIAQLKLHIPPLRNRPLDIVGIARKYVARLITDTDIDIPYDEWTQHELDSIVQAFAGMENIVEQVTGTKVEVFGENIVRRRIVQSKANAFVKNAEEVLTNSNWPRNVRQVESYLLQMYIATGGKNPTKEFAKQQLVNEGIDILTESDQAVNHPYMGWSLEQVEKQHIKETLNTADSKQDAAVQLGISRDTLRRKRKKYDLE